MTPESEQIVDFWDPVVASISLSVCLVCFRKQRQKSMVAPAWRGWVVVLLSKRSFAAWVLVWVPLVSMLCLVLALAPWLGSVSQPLSARGWFQWLVSTVVCWCQRRVHLPVLRASARHCYFFWLFTGVLVTRDEAGGLSFNLLPPGIVLLLLVLALTLVLILIFVVLLLLPRFLLVDAIGWGAVTDLGLAGRLSLPFGLAREGFAADDGNRFLEGILVVLPTGVALAVCPKDKEAGNELWLGVIIAIDGMPPVVLTFIFLFVFVFDMKDWGCFIFDRGCCRFGCWTCFTGCCT